MGYRATADRLPVQALFDLKGPRDALVAWCGDSVPALPAQPNYRHDANNVTVAHLGPGHWMVRAPVAAEDSLATALRPDAAPPEISIVCVSDTLAFFRIHGPDADKLMAIGSPLDLHPGAFPEAGASFTEFFSLRALVMRAPGGFDLAVEQSLGPFVADCLARALR